MFFDSTSLAGKKIVIIGDVMLDRYVWGEVLRISPEAPVPVVRVREHSEVLGGAGNVAANCANLGCSVTLVGLCGADEAGTQLQALLETKGIQGSLLVDSTRPTITKTRVMALKQQLFRLDEELFQVLTPELAAQCLARIEESLASAQAVILSDYGKGLLQSPGFCQKVIERCRSHNLPVLVDPKGLDWARYEGAFCVTPNTTELELVAGPAQLRDDASLASSGLIIREQFGFTWLLVTRGPKGMCLLGEADAPQLIAAQAREVFDVSGAGDTVIATLAAGIAAGLSMPLAARLANTAAGIVVGKVGTQPITLSELDTAMRLNDLQGRMTGPAKVALLDAARIQVQAWRTSGAKVVFTNGCFDLLHPGHINLLHQARALGDKLVVGVNTDASVRRLKGPNRPILLEQDRAAILCALSSVDMVVLFDEDGPELLIKALQPDILAKGADYRPEEVVGREIVEAYGGQVRLIPLVEGYSSSNIANKMLASKMREGDRTDDQ